MTETKFRLTAARAIALSKQMDIATFFRLQTIVISAETGSLKPLKHAMITTLIIWMDASQIARRLRQAGPAQEVARVQKTNVSLLLEMD